jgi:tripartite-type tricarboxylate transporter receptor subunit TctC
MLDRLPLASVRATETQNLIAPRGASQTPPPRGTLSRRRLLAAALAACVWPHRTALAADEDRYPGHAIRLILPSPVGGTSDLLGRLVGTHLSQALGVPVVVESRPGAAGRIALEQAAVAAPDGYTLFLANNGVSAIVPGELEAQRSELERAFTPVAKLVSLPIVIVVNPSLGVRSLADLIARARSGPGTQSYASGGVGSTSHMAARLLFKRAGVTLTHIPYAGTSSALKDVLAGEVPILFTHLGTVATLLRGGRLRAVAVTGPHRMAEFPGVGTVAEAGYAGFDVTTWHGVVVPAGTPRAIVLRLHDELVRIVALPEVGAQFALMGMEPAGGTPEQFAAEIDADVRRWAEVIRAGGMAE